MAAAKLNGKIKNHFISLSLVLSTTLYMRTSMYGDVERIDINHNLVSFYAAVLGKFPNAKRSLEGRIQTNCPRPVLSR